MRTLAALLFGAGALLASPLRAEPFACAGLPAATPALAAAGKPAGGRTGRAVPTRGRVQVLVVYAAFAGEAAPPPPASAADLFDVDRVGSLSHFYDAMSFGRLRLTGTVLPWRYSSSQGRSAYLAATPGELGGFGRFVVEVLSRVDEDVDFRRFDNDGPDGLPDSGDDDGFVDYVFVNLPSVPRGFLLGGATGVGGLGGDYATREIGHDGNPVRVRGGIGYGAVQQEGDFAQTVGVMAHEFGHGLGLPDLYDLTYDDPADDSAGIGQWGLMGWGALGWNGDDGPNPLSAWSLEQLGWISPGDGRLVPVDRDLTGVRLDPLWAGGAVARVPILDGNDPEYLLLEQRTRDATYYDRHLPAEGLLVWRVRPEALTNAQEHDKLVDLVCADGRFRDAGYPLGSHPDGVFGGDNLDFWAHDGAYARAHGGNLGDDGDIFDGVPSTRLHMDGNPSTLPRGPTALAFAGLDLRLRRQGAAMVVDVALPRWAGTVAEEVEWSGRVFVDGDLRVAPRGVLRIREGTRVRFSGRDRLRQGLDPDLVELHVEGDVDIMGVPGSAGRVEFEAMVPGQPWYGILLEPTSESRVVLPPDGYDLSDAVHGISFPRAPADLQGTAQARTRLVDVSGPLTAGNGDGQLNPGETFQLVVDVANWSTQLYGSPRGVLRSLSPRVRNAERQAQVASNLDFAVLYPGVERTLAWPSLTLGADAEAGEEVRFHVLLSGLGAKSRSDTLSFVVRGGYPAHTAEIAIPGRSTRAGLTLVPATMVSAVEARVEGQVTAMELVLRPSDPELPTLQQPLTPQAGFNWVGSVRPPAPGAYQLLLRVHGPDGSTAFSDARLELWATPGPDLPVLAFVGSHYSLTSTARIRRVLEEALDLLRMDLQLVQLKGDDPTRYRALLEHYAHRGGIVVWLADVEPAMEPTLRSLLLEGGRLLLASRTFYPSDGVRRFLSEMLFTDLGGESLSSSRVNAIYPLEPMAFAVQHSWHTPVAPAEPLLLDDRQRAVGLRLDVGSYRAVYLAFDLDYVAKDVQRTLFGPALHFLQPQMVHEATLEAIGGDLRGLSLLAAPGAALDLTARITGGVRRAELVVTPGPPAYGEPTAVLPLQRRAPEGDLQVFGGRFETGLPGRYRLSLRSYDEDDRAVLTPSYLWVLVHDTGPPLLVLRDGGGSALPGPLVNGASTLQLDGSDWPLYEALLDRYLDRGDAVVYWGGGDIVSPRLLQAMRAYLSRGGRLLVSSRRLQDSPEGEAFLREVLRVGRPQSRQLAEVHTTDFVPDLELPFSTLLVPFAEVLAPGVPLLRTEAGQIVGVRVDEDGHRVLFMPFDLAGLNGDAGPELASRLLASLRAPAAGVRLSVDGAPIVYHAALVPADRPATIRARVAGDVTGVELVVQPYDDVTRTTRLPMTRGATEGDSTLFTVAFQPPAMGHYLISLRAPAVAVVAPSLRLDAVTFADWHPVLLLLGEQLPQVQRDRLEADALAVLRRQGLDANVVVAPEEGPLYDALVSRYLGPGEMVVWSGRLLMADAQAALHRYLEQGGRALLASADFRYAPGAADFLRAWLGVADIGMGFPVRSARLIDATGTGRDLAVEFAPLRLVDGVSPSWSDESGRVAGVRVERGYRASFLSFDLSPLAADERRRLLEDEVRFLSVSVPEQAPGTAPAPRLVVEGDLSRLVPATALAPSVTVSNQGDAAGGAFRVGYQLLRGDTVVVSLAVQQPPLAAGDVRSVPLPRWAEAAPGDYLVRFAVGFAADLDYGTPTRLHVVAPTRPFSRVDLPGDVDLGNGAALFDVDDDGDLDLYLVRRGGGARLLRNDGGAFVDIAAAAGIDAAGNERGLAVGDVDGDGDLDLYLVSEAANRLLRNDGGTAFRDITEGDLGDEGDGRSAAFFDADGDGDLDLYLVEAAGPNRLFVQGDGGFSEAAAAFGLDDGGSGRGLVVGDVDDDGDDDLFVANNAGGSVLLRNDGGRFTPAQNETGLLLAGAEVGAAFGDADGDGRLDLFVAVERGPNRLFVNVGDGRFVDAASRDSLDLGHGAVGAAFLDLDNDGDLDLATTAVNAAAGGDELFLNRQPFLLPLGAGLGLAATSAGRGLSVGDIDGDGAVDLFVADAGGSRLYRNTFAPTHWLRVELAGPGGNRRGLGARVEVRAGGVRAVRQVHSALGYASQVQPAVHVGLGEGAVADSVLVRWPGGQESLLLGVAADGLLRIVHPDRPTAVAELDAALPAEVRLEPAFPNPFNQAVTIGYTLPQDARVRLVLYDAAGQVVRRLVDGERPAGAHRVAWDGTDNGGRRIGSGVYFVHLQAGGRRLASRVALIQ